MDKAVNKQAPLMLSLAESKCVLIVLLSEHLWYSCGMVVAY